MIVFVDMCLPYMTEDIPVDAIIKVALDTAPKVYKIIKEVIKYSKECN
jgi:hypothetical protein